ncbi:MULTISPECIES: restriction endonuclease subunit S [Acinetobacter]|uniref:restriction endonuclease subunit S n=1 Tax=Acinetobacter TaxID=469 RepID=UPI0005C9346E|nr:MULTISPECIES: restriction endonuclease subunit S [Acinetobacter]
MEFKQYPSYKPSGVEWLDDVPEHWSLKRFYYLFTENKKKNIGLKETNVLSLSYGNIKEKNIDDNKGLLPESFETYQIIKPNDIVFRFTDLQNDKRSLRSAISKYHGIITSAYIAVKTKQNADFYNYLFRAYDLQKVFYSMGEGMRQSLKMDELNKMPVVLPSEDEQKRIVSFLDTETTRIDKLISKQEKLIELLEEQRKSIISHAVTKGLNPNALMKDSGVEWLGRVPCDWQYYSIKRTIKVLTDYTANGSFADLAKNVNYLDYGFSRLVRLTDLREDLNNNGVYITEDAHKYLKKSELFGGELLLANVGAYAGFACLMPYKKIKATLAPNMFLLRFKEQRINNKFMYYLINSKTIQYQFQVSMTSTAQPKLNKDNVKNIVMFLPTLQIQNEIVEYLDSENLILDNLIFKQQALIEKLKEYRASIISHAVTGKIDVREHMA